MKILAEAQHTPEWYAARKGRVTASMAQVCLARRGTKTRTNYVMKIADDLDGVPDFDDVDVKPWHADGAYYESWARGWYAFEFEVDVSEIGFVAHEQHDWLGCSPDGLVGDDGCLEIKYRKYLRTFDQHAKVGVRATVNAQAQTQMLVLDRRWCDYVNYWRWDDERLEKGHRQRIHRDQAYIDNVLLPAFVAFWADVQAELRRRELQRERARA